MYYVSKAQFCIEVLTAEKNTIVPITDQPGLGTGV